MSTIAEVRGLSPIFTEASAVSVDATAYAFADGNNSDESAAYCEAVLSCDAGDLGLSGHHIAGGASLQDGVITNSTTWWKLANTTGGRLQNKESSIISSISVLPDDINKYGSVWSVNEGKVQVSFNGTYGTEETPTTNLPHISVGSANSPEACRIRNLQRYDITSYQEGKDLIDGLMA